MLDQKGYLAKNLQEAIPRYSRAFEGMVASIEENSLTPPPSWCSRADKYLETTHLIPNSTPAFNRRDLARVADVLWAQFCWDDETLHPGLSERELNLEQRLVKHDHMSVSEFCLSLVFLLYLHDWFRGLNIESPSSKFKLSLNSGQITKPLWTSVWDP